MEQTTTPLNRALADTLSGRISSELSVVSGRASFWKAIGVGILGLGVGGAVGIGFYGYSLITQNAGQMQAFSTTLQKALSTVELRGVADGKVEIKSPQLTITKGAMVSIDPSSRLLVDPNARILADGEIRVQAPSISIPRSPTPKMISQTRTISNFTIFKTVPFERGDVVTGWNFLTSAQENPTQQYCYYHEHADNPDIAIQINLAIDGTPEPDKSTAKGINFTAALARCVWFNRG